MANLSRPDSCCIANFSYIAKYFYFFCVLNVTFALEQNVNARLSNVGYPYTPVVCAPHDLQ